ncbi:PHB depolymerase family esterase [Polaromonas sp. CG_9.11]|uniref:extracellular catalytic domain type 1 short-chain-length polyhydroxyalkanoate depolymerase n=1 Tax=Polaromonas sp. CG_9.11 TaxID=2787730 RepID=UPI0018CA8FB9|nr:PHB depolymerase family esterase [Polaromonas sp. CG_9.11]MBG6077924.1 poly(hydroxyalkanoate) depolymerase family esterase [Polaromonas sp. CG_9.11]
MTKSLTSLWLNNLRRVGKAQQAQGRKLFKSLLTTAARTPLAKSVKPAKVAKTLRTATLKTVKAVMPPGIKTAKQRRKAAAAPARPAATLLPALPGSWKKSFFSQPGTGLAPARRMMYWLYLPSGVCKAPLPLVVMLHGCKQTATDFAASTRMNQLAERKGFAVLYPQQSAAADANRCWHWYRRTTQQGHGDVSLIAEMIKQVGARNRLDTTRTYVAGLSAGAGLATILALRHPQLIAAAGLHSAPVFGTSDSPMSGFQAMQQGAGVHHRDAVSEFTDSKLHFPGMPVMLIQGKSDSVVRRVNADHLSAQFSIVDAPWITSTHPVVRSYAGRSSGRSPRHAYKTTTYYAGRKPMLVKCEIDGLGHAWSGGEGSLDYSAPEGPDATLLLWAFFSGQQRQQSAPVVM